MTAGVRIVGTLLVAAGLIGLVPSLPLNVAPELPSSASNGAQSPPADRWFVDLGSVEAVESQSATAVDWTETAGHTVAAAGAWESAAEGAEAEGWSELEGWPEAEGWSEAEEWSETEEWSEVDAASEAEELEVEDEDWSVD